MGLVQGLPPMPPLLVGWAKILVFHEVWSAKIQEYPKHHFKHLLSYWTVVRRQTETDNDMLF